MRPLVAAVLAAVVFLCAGLWLGGHPGKLPEPLRDVFVDETSSLSGEAAEIIEDNYYRDVTRAKLNDGSIAGMMDALRRSNKEDRYSHYFDPDQAKVLEEETEGSFSGIGLSVNDVKRGLLVVQVFKGSPAAEAGIKPGDVIVAVEGKSIAGQSSQLSTAKIKGPEGTDVGIGVLRPSTGRKRNLTIERKQISTPVVEPKLRQAGGRKVGYISLLGFSRGAHDFLRAAAEKLEKRGAQGFLLDLRGNPGGLLDEAVLTSGVFLPDGDKVVSTSSRTEGDKVYRTSGDPVPPLPMVVLIDRGTASAAEILASALADNDYATIAGTRSFGKGLFQNVIDLSNGGQLDLSVGKFFTADGISLAPKGIHPEVFAKDDPDTKPDEGLQRALRVLGDQVSSGSSSAK